MKCSDVKGKVLASSIENFAMWRRALAVLFTTFLCGACAQDATKLEQTTQQTPGLESLAEAYFEASLELNPLRATFIGDMRCDDRLANHLGSEHRAGSEALDRQYLDKLATIDASQLNRQERLTYEVFKLNLEDNLEMLGFPAHLPAINQFYSFANSFAQLGSGASAHPFNTEQYRDFLSRVDGYTAFLEGCGLYSESLGKELGIYTDPYQNFDVRDFLTQILIDGALPLSLLESKIDAWIASN